jgi:MOSC domain-containing protein YiiM
MRLVSVNVSAGRYVSHGGAEVLTGIFKQPVSGPVRVTRLGLDGDFQADRHNHGGVDKAVYAYALEHYDWWRQELGRSDLAPGSFGENLTIEGFDEAAVAVGDVFEVGGARLSAVQPRKPCFKLGLRLGDPSMVQRFMRSLRLGVYFRVVQEGQVEAGQPVEIVERAGDRRMLAEMGREALAGRQRRSQA